MIRKAQLDLLETVKSFSTNGDTDFRLGKNTQPVRKSNHFTGQTHLTTSPNPLKIQRWVVPQTTVAFTHSPRNKQTPMNASGSLESIAQILSAKQTTALCLYLQAWKCSNEQ